MTSIVLEHFADAECIYRGKRATIFRVRDNEGNNLVLKTHTKLIGRESDLHFLRKEYEIGKSLAESINVVSYLELVEQVDKEGRPRAMVIMNDCGSNLGKQIPQDGFALDHFLALAIQCAQGLRDIHKIGVTHRDIKPTNFVRYCLNGQLTNR
jgi:serine/threonine protein kinase